MSVLFTTANLRVLLEPDQAKLIDEHTLTQIAFGTTALMRPDFDRNAEMALVRPEGTVEPLRDTAVAVDVLSTVRLVFVNDAARGWADALADAVFTVQYFGAPAVLVYNAADFFSLERDNPAIRDRLRVLADGVNRRGSSLNVVAHGWGAYLSIAALHTHPRANITAVNPYPGPWRAAEFRQALCDPRPALALARAKPPRG